MQNVFNALGRKNQIRNHLTPGLKIFSSTTNATESGAANNIKGIQMEDCSLDDLPKFRNHTTN
jgi:hypothetical protein